MGNFELQAGAKTPMNVPNDERIKLASSYSLIDYILVLG